MDRTRRLNEEREFHDRQAKERSLQLDSKIESATANSYLDHAPWIRKGLDLLEPLQGKITLDLGAGHGWAAVELSRRGAKVSGTDLSLGYCAEAKNRHRRFGYFTPFFRPMPSICPWQMVPWNDCGATRFFIISTPTPQSLRFAAFWLQGDGGVL